MSGGYHASIAEDLLRQVASAASTAERTALSVESIAHSMIAAREDAHVHVEPVSMKTDDPLRAAREKKVRAGRWATRSRVPASVTEAHLGPDPAPSVSVEPLEKPRFVEIDLVDGTKAWVTFRVVDGTLTVQETSKNVRAVQYANNLVTD